MKYPEHLLKLISALKKLPGVGSKSAERYAFSMLGWPEERLKETSDLIHELKKKITHCSTCSSLIDQGHCPFCENPKRQLETLCVVASPRDVFLVEETRSYTGLYHVLGGLISPFQGKFADPAALSRLKERVAAGSIKEVILTFDSTLEGDATALFLKKELELFPLKISRLAFGMPMGSSLDFIDGGTLAKALSGRREI